MIRIKPCPEAGLALLEPHTSFFVALSLEEVNQGTVGFGWQLPGKFVESSEDRKQIGLSRGGAHGPNRAFQVMKGLQDGFFGETHDPVL
jgi:hypothetical protein